MPAPLQSAAIQSRLRTARIAHLATIDSAQRPHLVPICFVYDHGAFYSPIDRKPKRVAAEQLARVRNVKANSQVALMVDHYSENWARLWYIQVRGTAKLLAGTAKPERARAIRLLRAKYAQYDRTMLPEDAPILRVSAEHVIFWGRL